MAIIKKKLNKHGIKRLFKQYIRSWLRVGHRIMLFFNFYFCFVIYHVLEVDTCTLIGNV